MSSYWTRVMKQIRENVYHVTFADLGKPFEKGYYAVEGLGEVLLDEADVRYLKEVSGKGYDPAWFVAKSDAIRNAYVVVSRQWPA